MKQTINLLPDEKIIWLTPRQMTLGLGGMLLALIAIAFCLYAYRVYLGFELHATQAKVKSSLALLKTVKSNPVVEELQKVRDDMKESLLIATESQKVMSEVPMISFSKALENLALSQTKGAWIQQLELERQPRKMLMLGGAIHPKFMVEMLQKLKSQPGMNQTKLSVIDVKQVEPQQYQFKVEGP